MLSFPPQDTSLGASQNHLFEQAFHVQEDKHEKYLLRKHGRAFCTSFLLELHSGFTPVLGVALKTLLFNHVFKFNSSGKIKQRERPVHRHLTQPLI